MKKHFIAHRRENDGKSQGLWEHLEEVSSMTGKIASKIDLREHGEYTGL